MSRARDTANQINRINSSAADATAITVDSSENVGIGTSSPSAPLHTYKNNTSAYNLFQGNAGSWVFGQADGKCQVGGLLGTHAGMVVDTSGDVGIGTSSPAVQNNGAGIVLDLANTGSANTTADNTELVVRSSSRYAALSFITPTDKAATINFGDTDDANIGIVQYNHADNAMSFSTSAAERVRIDSDGLKFNGDTAAANALNDYEEGTWNPAGVNFTVASITKATYTKIGNRVNVIFWINSTNGSGNSNSASISGLPFSIVDKGYTCGSLNITANNPVTTNIQIRGNSNSTRIDILTANDAGVSGADIDNGHLIGTLTYETNS